MGFCYLDSQVGAIQADWSRGIIFGDREYMDLLKELQAQLHKRGKMLWINALVAQPYYDISFWETLPYPWLFNTWFDQAEAAMMAKVYEPAGSATVPAQWMAGERFKELGTYNEAHYIDLALGAGFMTTYPCLDPYDIDSGYRKVQLHDP